MVELFQDYRRCFIYILLFEFAAKILRKTIIPERELKKKILLYWIPLIYLESKHSKLINGCRNIIKLNKIFNDFDPHVRSFILSNQHSHWKNILLHSSIII